MTQQPTSQTEKGFLKNDRKLVCSMLVIYGLCIVGLIAATFWSLNRRRLTLSADATSTAFAIVTQQANATRTAIAHTTEQAGYEFMEPFNSNKNKWRTGSEKSEYWIGNTKITDGVYLWEVTETKDTFIAWSDFSVTEYIKDFDAYVDTKVVEGELGDICSGFLFRISPVNSDKGYYYFSLCNNSLAVVSYHTQKDGWERIASLPYYNRSKDWNRLEIHARGSHFEFLINGDWIYEMYDDRQKAGSLALVIEVGEKAPAKILFDNFGFQPR